MQEMTIETALTLLAIFTPLNMVLWFGVGLGTFQLDIEPKIKTEGKRYQTADKCELWGLYSITGQILQLGGQT
ncbi:hypothetical protein ACTGWF_08980 [Streptococcus suis]